MDDKWCEKVRFGTAVEFLHLPKEMNNKMTLAMCEVHTCCTCTVRSERGVTLESRVPLSCTCDNPIVHEKRDNPHDELI